MSQCVNLSVKRSSNTAFGAITRSFIRRAVRNFSQLSNGWKMSLFSWTCSSFWSTRWETLSSVRPTNWHTSISWRSIRRRRLWYQPFAFWNACCIAYLRNGVIRVPKSMRVCIKAHFLYCYFHSRILLLRSYSQLWLLCMRKRTTRCIGSNYGFVDHHIVNKLAVACENQDFGMPFGIELTCVSRLRCYSLLLVHWKRLEGMLWERYEALCSVFKLWKLL